MASNKYIYRCVTKGLRECSLLCVGGDAGVSSAHLHRHDVMQPFRDTSYLYTVFVFNTECFNVVQVHILNLAITWYYVCLSCILGNSSSNCLRISLPSVGTLLYWCTCRRSVQTSTKKVGSFLYFCLLLMNLLQFFLYFLSKIVAFLSNPKKKTVQVMDKALKTNHLKEILSKSSEENW